ncbi:replication initiator protein [Microviridae sp.]|nr:replication initiator protein [Microviridae sp.]
MPCYKPLTGWQTEDLNENGKRPMVFAQPKKGEYKQLEVPCRQCIGCRLEYSRQWAMRITHEQQLHKENAFITLTYDPEHLPGHSLDKREWQLFLKKFRKALHPKKIRFFMAGEYGGQPELGRKFGRPHFHAIIFGWYPEKNDLSPVKKTNTGQILYHSDYLSKIWGKGFVSVGSVTFESAAYVARYVTKKITGEIAEEHYTDIDFSTGESIKLEPEFTLASRRPGIGGDWFKKYKKDLEKGFITVRGKKMNAAKFYDKKFDEIDPYKMDEIKEKREERARDLAHDNTTERLVVKEKIKRKKLKLLPRGNVTS